MTIEKLIERTERYMKVYQSLPDGYVESNEHVVLKCEKDWIRITQVLVITFCLYIIGLFIHAWFHWPVPDNSKAGFVVDFILFFIIPYPHELIHKGAAMLCGAQRVHCSFKFGKRYTGSKDEYFDKGAHLVFSLAPVVLISLCCFGVCLILPRGFFVYIWLLFSYQVASASNDLRSARNVLKTKEEILIRDTGKETTVYVKENDKKE